MSSASDISNLFQILGVSPSHYQEVERTEQVRGLRGRWSMQPGSFPAWRALPEQPVSQSNPQPVVAAQQPDALSFVFARLLEPSEARADVAQRQTP